MQMRILWLHALSMKENIAAPHTSTDADREQQVVWCLTGSYISLGSFVFSGVNRYHVGT